MPLSEPLVKVRILSVFDGFVAAKGVDPAGILRAVGLGRDQLVDPERYISLNIVADLFEIAARRTGDTAFGLHYAEAFPIGASGLLGHIMLSAPTVGEALEAAVRYLELLMLPMQPELVDDEDAGTYSLLVGVPSTFTAPQLHYMSFLMACVVFRIRIAAGPDWLPAVAEFKHRRPEALDEYVGIFGRGLNFNSRRYRIDIDHATFNKAMPQQIVGLFDSVRDLGDRQLNEKRLQQDVDQHLAAVLARQLDDHAAFDLATAAELCETSARALQWRLEQAGTSYERVLASVRQQQAAHLLRDTDLSIGDIAAQLGYSEQSALARATQSWFKRSPSAQREWLRSQSIELDD